MNQKQMIVLAWALGISVVHDARQMLDIAGFARFLADAGKAGK